MTIWTVRAGEDIFVRSAYGYDNGWFQRALRAGTGRIRAGGVEREVRFEAAAGPDVASRVSDAYHAKYDRYGARTVATVVSPDAVRATLLVTPV